MAAVDAVDTSPCRKTQNLGDPRPGSICRRFINFLQRLSRYVKYIYCPFVTSNPTSSFITTRKIGCVLCIRAQRLTSAGIRILTFAELIGEAGSQ